MEIHDVYREPNIFRVVKSKGKRWTGNVAYVVATRNVGWKRKKLWRNVL